MRKLLSILLAFSLFITVSASDSIHIIDYSMLLTNYELATLESKAESISDTYALEIVIFTVPSLDGAYAQSYADDEYDELIGDHDGILLLIAMEEREWAVTTGAHTVSVITDNDVDDIMDAILDDLSDGAYYEAFDDFLDGIENEYEAYESGEEADEPGGFVRFLIALAIGAAVAGITLYFMRRKMNTARAQSGASSYMTDGSYDLYRCQDIYLYSHTTKVRKAESSSGGSRGGGRSRGGRSGRF